MAEEEKQHWQKFKELLKCYGNGKVTLDFQDGLPVFVEEITGSKKQIDLTK